MTEVVMLCCLLIGVLSGVLIGGGLFLAVLRRFVRGSVLNSHSEEHIREVTQRLKHGSNADWAVGEFVRYALDNWT